MNRFIHALFIGLAMVIILLPYFIIEINKDKSPKIEPPEVKEIELQTKEKKKKTKNKEKTEEKTKKEDKDEQKD